MNLSMKWLADYVDIGPVSPREFSEAMTMSGSKVEGYEQEGSEIKNVLVGRVEEIVRHPDSDHMFICQVNVGKPELIQIVTGAQNVHQGDYVPVAMDDSWLPGGKHIRCGKLRGEESNGMLCSLAELGLTAHDFPYAQEDGIFILQEPDMQLGEDIRTAIGLNDTCVEFEITSNRPDCLSVTGLAREAAATFDKPLNLPAPQVEHTVDDIRNHLSVEVQAPDLCLRYTARMVKNIKIAPSPRWMRERLRASGVRPINNIVDITNYVMLEYGQPMHAFDHKYVEGGKIVVRNAKAGETIVTLDGVERQLTPDMLVIADAVKPSAVAGVMGGEYSGIMDDTNMVIFESACFNGPSVRVTAKKLGMRTESSSRFEKQLDPAITIPAVERACQLVELLGAGEVVGGMIDVDNADHTPRRIPLEPDWINQFLGIQVPVEEMRRILTKLECKFDGDDVLPPSFRGDLEHKADIAEEIARFYGYNRIPSTAIRGVADGRYTPKQQFEQLANQVLLAQGLYEVATYSFISPKYYDKIRLPQGDWHRNCVTILNPLGEDTSVMRTTTVPSMLEVLSRNYNNRNKSAALYEIGCVYLPVEGQELPDERQKVTIGMYGEGYDFFSLKGIVETLLEQMRVEGVEYTAASDLPTYHPGRCARLTVGDTELGIIAEVHPAVCENYQIGTRAYVAYLDLPTLFAHVAPEKGYRPLPKFPPVSRDLALLCDEELPVAAMEKAIRNAVGGTLETLALFDVYRGAQVAQGKKSVAFSLTMRAADRTLTDEEADAAIQRALQALAALGAQLRS
ncbi:MAG TPA: phenylalanine--tRNA ligase subunit beta [Candidatus Anaerotruncus excrementipullorum]|uniref:Phenylalanine--tRNA ligase beta subunit n=1 Tax=Candidatus Anaerotruncus excrementipullorum TaxID=2838465 RepID=A0A9D1WS27_9FIRM|nr:phenylalanine--tRNA ligase subunit beta [Candidatus Anaerotruncus excrementipullorum]